GLAARAAHTFLDVASDALAGSLVFEIDVAGGAADALLHLAAGLIDLSTNFIVVRSHVSFPPPAYTSRTAPPGRPVACGHSSHEAPHPHPSPLPHRSRPSRPGHPTHRNRN